jgi:hypothetical protein
MKLISLTIIMQFLVCSTLFCACSQQQQTKPVPQDTAKTKQATNTDANTIDSTVSSQFIKDIAPPSGFELDKPEQGSLGKWLHSVKLKKDNTIYHFDGTVKPFQEGKVAVLDISVPKADIQQCADALMRLKAEYHYQRKEFAAIKFKTVEGPYIGWQDYIAGARWKDKKGHLYRYTVNQIVDTSNAKNCRAAFDNYLFLVFSFCNTFSLNQQVQQNILPTTIVAGDIFIKGGFPGHAIIAVGTATNKQGQRVAMFAQSFMPAQSIHIIKNPLSDSPWFLLDNNSALAYDEYSFLPTMCKRW